jgi:hypothetical protein
MATTTNYGWVTPNDTDLVKDGAAAIRTLGSSIDTTTKALNPSTTLGDIEYRSATANTNTRLPLGTAGQVLTVNGGATAPVWAAAPSGGKLLQVLSVTKDDTFSSTSTSFTDVTGLSISITPSSATSKILVLYNVSGSQDVGVNIAQGQLMRDSTAINVGAAAGVRTQATSDPFSVANQIVGTTVAGSFLDSPATTSATTYKFQVKTSGPTVFINRTADDSNLGLRSRTVSTITVMEIGA